MEEIQGGSAQELKILPAEFQTGFLAPERRNIHGYNPHYLMAESLADSLLFVVKGGHLPSMAWKESRLAGHRNRAEIFSILALFLHPAKGAETSSLGCSSFSQPPEVRESPVGRWQ